MAGSRDTRTQGRSIDDAALLKEQGDESTAGGEELDDRADFRIGQVPADKTEDGAQPGIARRLAETGEQVGKASHCGSFRAWKSRPVRMSRAAGGGISVQPLSERSG